MKNKIITITMSVILIMSLAGCSKSGVDNSSNVTTSVSDTIVNQTNTEIDAAQATVAVNSATTNPTTANTTTANSTSSANISEDEAKKAALSHAGLTEEAVTFIKIRLDKEDGRLVYEVDFYSSNTEYDYEIDAASGEIVSYDYDVENYNISSGTSDGQTNSEYIGEEAAKSIALAKVPGATESDMRLQLDYDDGKAVYEGSIVYNKLKYEFEIDAADGTIIEWESESVYD